MKLSSVIFKSIFFISFMSACFSFLIIAISQYNSCIQNQEELQKTYTQILSQKNNLSPQQYIVAQQKLIEKEINVKQTSLKDAMLIQVENILISIMFATILFYFISKKVTSYVNANIDYLIHLFREATEVFVEINTKNIKYKEFEILAKKMNNILRDRNRTQVKLQDYISIVNDNVLISSSDKNGIITNVSEAFCNTTGYSKEELLGKPYKLLRNKKIKNVYYKKMWDNLNNGLKWTGEIKAKKKNGEVYWVETIIHPEYKNNKLSNFTAIKHDITEKKKLENLSITDDLTGLYNKRYFKKKIEEEISRAKRNNKYLSFIISDIDYFKKYNDTYGHQAGDAALKKVASIFSKYTNRACDFAFRIGGEEFCLIFSSDDSEKSFKFANKIRESIEKLTIEHKTSDVHNNVTASIGLVVKKGMELTNSETLFNEADKALYKAKNLGRNIVCRA